MTPRFPTPFWRQILRRSWRQPFLACLNVIGLALGITVFLAIQIANRGAPFPAFQTAAELTTGRADLEIRALTSPTAIFPAVAATEGVRAATPLVEGDWSLLPDEPGEYLRILGVDPSPARTSFPFV